MLDNYFERSVLLNAVKAVFVTDTMRKDYIKKYTWLENKAKVLYWGYNEEAFRSLPANPLDRSGQTLLKEENVKNSTEEIVLHAGNIFDYQNPKAFWKLLKSKIDSGRKLKIKFIGTVGPEIKSTLNDLGLSPVTEYAGFLSYREMLAELHKVSYLMVCASEPRHVPGKLFEYLRTGKPIIAFGDGNEEVNKILTDANAGMLFRYSDDGSEFFENISKFGTNIALVKKYDRRNIAEELAGIIT